jgi:hypothetical protein
VLAVFLATPVGLGTFGVVTAVRRALAALTDGRDVLLELPQPAAQVRVFRFQLGDPLLQGAHESPDGSLGLG